MVGVFIHDVLIEPLLMTPSKVHVTSSLKDNEAGFVVANLYIIYHRKPTKYKNYIHKKTQHAYPLTKDIQYIFN